MKHPNRDEWAPYIFGEARHDEARRLKAHLDTCDECAAELAGWRRSLRALEHWELPHSRRTPAVLVPVFRWAVAAAIVLFAGIAMGRLSAPGSKEIQAQVVTRVQAMVAAELQKTVAETQARLAAASEARLQELWDVFSDELQTARDEDRRAMLAFAERRRLEQEERYIGLRRDLEMLATQADQELRQANFKLTQLAGINQNIGD